MRFIFWIVFGGFVGFALGRIFRRRALGPLWDIVIGIAGAIGGGIAVHQWGWPAEYDLPWTLVGAVGGAIILSLLYHWLFAWRRKSLDDRSKSQPERKAA